MRFGSVGCFPFDLFDVGLLCIFIICDLLRGLLTFGSIFFTRFD